MTAPAWLADDDAVRAVRDRLQQVNEQDYPIRVATLPEDALTDEEIAKVSRAMDSLAASAPPEWRTVPPGPRWTPQEIRDFLAENVTVVAPEETLVIRAQDDWTPNHVREVQESLHAALEYGSISFRCLVVPGGALGKATETGPGDAARAAARTPSPGASCNGGPPHGSGCQCFGPGSAVSTPAMTVGDGGL